jgi:tetratricopeptide (TPR) repeat protein
MKLQIEGVGVVKEKMDKWQLLGEYFEYEKDFNQAVKCYKKDLKRNIDSHKSQIHLLECSKQLGKLDEAESFLKAIRKRKSLPWIEVKVSAVKYMYSLFRKAMRTLATSPRQLTPARMIQGLKKFRALWTEKI